MGQKSTPTTVSSYDHAAITHICLILIRWYAPPLFHNGILRSGRTLRPRAAPACCAYTGTARAAQPE